jgi:transcriptional regulator with XRE-family HTH domain
MRLRLRAVRLERGYSVRELARRANVSYPTITRIETGVISPTVTMLEKLAKALKIHVTAFFPSPPTRPRRRRK